MKVKQTPIAAAVGDIAGASPAQAQEAVALAKTAAQLDQVVITGIRASLQTAANIKKNANAVVDAVSAEDVGKRPTPTWARRWVAFSASRSGAISAWAPRCRSAAPTRR